MMESHYIKCEDKVNMYKYYRLVLICFCGMTSSAYAEVEDKQRKELQKQYDYTCEQARNKKIQPLKNEKIAECINAGETKEACAESNKYLGARKGSRAPLFMDLPECVKAFEYNKQSSDRNSD